MKQRCIIISYVTEPLSPDEAIPVVRDGMADQVTALGRFNITTDGEPEIATTQCVRFDDDGDMVGAVRITQRVEGHWLDFLHARRAGVYKRPATLRAT